MNWWKNIRVHSNHAYFSNPVAGSGDFDVRQGEGWKTSGLEITPDHRFIFVEPFDKMACEVYFRPKHFLLFKLQRRPMKITRRTRFPLADIKNIDFGDGWDDSSYSFWEIDADQVVDLRIRPNFHPDQITSPDQLVRGNVILYCGWHSGFREVIPELMVVLEGEFKEPICGFPSFKGLFLGREKGNWEFWPSLQDTGVIPDEKGYFTSHSYLVATAQTMTEAEIAEALSHKQKI